MIIIIFELWAMGIGMIYGIFLALMISLLTVRVFKAPFKRKRKRKNDELTYEDQKVLYGEIEAAVNNLTDDELRIIYGAIQLICIYSS